MPPGRSPSGLADGGRSPGGTGPARTPGVPARDPTDANPATPGEGYWHGQPARTPGHREHRQQRSTSCRWSMSRSVCASCGGPVNMHDGADRARQQRQSIPADDRCRPAVVWRGGDGDRGRPCRAGWRAGVPLAVRCPDPGAQERWCVRRRPHHGLRAGRRWRCAGRHRTGASAPGEHAAPACLLLVDHRPGHGGRGAVPVRHRRAAGREGRHGCRRPGHRHRDRLAGQRNRRAFDESAPGRRGHRQLRPRLIEPQPGI